MREIYQRFFEEMANTIDEDKKNPAERSKMVALFLQDIENYLKFNTGQSESWNSLLNELRCIVLAEAGAGKTLEFKERASLMNRKGEYAFFIRIEDIIFYLGQIFKKCLIIILKFYYSFV